MQVEVVVAVKPAVVDSCWGSEGAVVVVVVVVAVAVAVAVAVVVVAVCYYIFALEKNYDFMPIKTNINTTFKVIFCGDELLCTVYENKV